MGLESLYVSRLCCLIAFLVAIFGIGSVITEAQLIGAVRNGAPQIRKMRFT